MKRVRRFPQRLVRWTSLCICLALLLTSLAAFPLSLVGSKGIPGQGQNNQEPKNDRARKVEPESARRGAPEGRWPNLDEVKPRRDAEPRAQAPISSTMRSKRKASETRRGNTISALPPARVTDAKGGSEPIILAPTGARQTDRKAARSHHALARRVVYDTSTSPAHPPGSASDRLRATRNAWALEPTASSGDSASSTARIDPFNQTGDPLLARDAEWSLPLMSLPGRGGLDLGLGLSYSSLIWTRAGDNIYFDEDHGTPSPGFRLGFPIVQGVFVDAQAGLNARLLITPGGHRIVLRQVGSSNIYEAADSSYLQLIDYGTSLLVRSTDGRQMSYTQFAGDWHCTQIKDRNGNYISVNYNGSGDITNITDTLGRVINLNYDGNANLISITQTWNGQTHTWATFGWSTQTMSLNFSSNISVIGTHNGEVFPVLTQVSLDDGSYFTFQYTGPGQVNLIRRYRYDNVQSSYTAYDYNNTTEDCPRISQTRVWAENWTGVNGVPSELATQYSGEPTDTWRQLVTPDGTVFKEFYGPGWQKGLTTQSEVWSGGVRQKWTTAAWTQDNTGVSYQMNPRVTETNIYDAEGNRRRTTIDYGGYAQWGLPNGVFEYAANGTTLLRVTYTDYNLSQAYLDRHIIGLVSAIHVSDGAWQVKRVFEYDAGGDQLQATSAAATQHDAAYGTGFITGRGNLSAVSRYDATDAGNESKKLTTRMGYDIDGSLIFTRDHLGHQSNASYADSFSDSVNRNTFAYPTTVTDADGFSSTLQYNYDFGARTRTQGPPPAGQSQGAIQITSYDSAARLQQVTMQNNGAYTRYVYGPNYVQSFSTVNTVADEAYAIQVFDGAGRVIGAANNHPGSAGGYSMVNIIYDQLGRAIRQSNPGEINSSWVPSGDEASGLLYTQQTYDWKGRPVVTTNTDGSQKYASYGGCGCAGGEVVTITDEVGRQQKVYSDVLGRQWKAEVLNWNGTVYSTTTNTFNARDQVTLLRQWAGAENGGGTYQDTTVSYDGYGRLQSKHVPEQDANTATVYAYNADDTINSVTDARGASATYSYNNRHLATGITHSAPAGIAPASDVAFAYDAAGNRTSMSDGVGSMTYNYDQLSRMTTETRSFTGLNGSYTLSYGYNLAGQLASLTESSQAGAAVGYSYDSIGRLAGVTASGMQVSSIMSGLQYRASGALKHAAYGDGTQLNLTYNSRQLLTRYELNNVSGTMGSQNQYYADGRVRYTQDLRDGNFDRGYTYDHAGRLSEATSGREARGEAPTYPYPAERPYRQTLSYDAWNNLGRTGMLWSEGQSDLPTYTNNRRSDWAYDAEGNAIGGGWAPYRVQDYDAAGQQVHVYEESWSGPAEFWVFHQNTIDQIYGGDGRPGKRVETRHSEDINQNVTNEVLTVHFLRSTVLGGVVIAEIDQYGQREGHVYVGGEKIADYNSWAPYGWMDFRHANPANGNWVSVHLPGTNGRRTEFDPLGATVGTFDPFPGQRSYNDMIGNDWLYQELGNPFDMGSGCGTLDGMPISCSELQNRMDTGSVAVELTYRTGRRQQLPLSSSGLGLFRVWFPDPQGSTLDPAFDSPGIIRVNHDEDDELGHYEYFSFGFGQGQRTRGSSPQKTETPQTICHVMADVAQDEANDAISMNPNNPRAALRRFDNEFSRLYVGGSITSPFQAYRWRSGTGREIDGRYAANGSGFREEFRDTGTEPTGGRDADQTHHFVAYFSIGINDGSLTYLLADLRKDNAGDKRLAEAAFNYGYELGRHPKQLRNVGNWIRNNICTGSQGHGLYK